MSVKNFLKKAKDIEDDHERRKKERQNKRSGGDDGEEIWLISYADLMTLLAAFFIMMFAISSLDKPKYEKVRKEMAEQFGGDYEMPNEQMKKAMEQMLAKLKVDKSVEVKATAQGVDIIFESTIFFDTLGAYIRQKGREILTKLINAIHTEQMKKDSQFKIVVEGHTDSRPIVSGQYLSNWELSGARAARVVHMFLEKGFAPSNLMAIGYADTQPLRPDRTPVGTWDNEALSKNRRVVIRILDTFAKEISWSSATNTDGQGEPVRIPAEEAKTHVPSPKNQVQPEQKPPSVPKEVIQPKPQGEKVKVKPTVTF